MPVRVRCSARLGLVVVDLTGAVTEQEFADRLVPLIGRPEISRLPRMLVDSSGAESTDGSAKAISGYARAVREEVDAELAPGSKLAVVAVRDEFFGLARMYEMYRDPTPVEIRVVRSRAEAEAFLGLPPGFERDLEEVG